MKNLIKIVCLLVLVIVFACGNNTDSPDPAVDQSAAVNIDGLLISGTSDSAKVEILLADNYLKKVIKGNVYDSIPSVTPNPSLMHTIKAQVKITNFSYFSNVVDITCDKDVPNNKIDVKLLGSNELGHDVWFKPNSSDGLFYANDLVTSTTAVQGPEDEIEEAVIFGGPSDIVYTFFCSGSDGNDYKVFFHSNYDQDNMNESSIIDFKANEFTGVIGVAKNNGETTVDMFFDKQ